MYRSVIAAEALRGGGHLLLESAVIRSLEDFRQAHPQAIESGGILLGFRRGNHLHITEATEPSDEDRGSRIHFWRSSSNHQRIAKEAWERSGGCLDYVGEWHTHPQVSPYPSRIDISEWLKITSQRPGQPMAFMILGATRNLWLGVDEGQGIKELRLTDCW